MTGDCVKPGDNAETWKIKLTVGTFSPRTAYQEVVGLNVAVDEILLMDSLNAGDL